MELENKREVDGERRGRGEQRKEIFVRHEHAANGKMDGGKGRVRRATFDDLNAIMDINNNMYDGFDYLPAMFYTFMHSKLHVIYVYEEDGKLISLMNFRFHPDCDDLVTGMSGRCRPSQEGRGLGASDRSPHAIRFVEEHPAISRYISDALCSPRKIRQLNKLIELNKLELNYRWGYLYYELANRQSLRRFASMRQMALGVIRPFSLSYTDGTEWLERSDQLVQFLSKYVVEFFPVGTNWVPVTANKAGLRELLAVANVLVSLDNGVSPDLMVRTDASGPRNTKSRWQEGNIIGLSHSSVVPCKNGLEINVFFYGDHDNLFLSHLYRHLLHYVSVTVDDVRFRMQLNMPLTIDSKYVREQLNEEMGELCDSPSEAVLHIADIPKAKL